MAAGSEAATGGVARSASESPTSDAADGGSWVVPHGDHAAIFLDGDGVAEIIDLTALDAGNERPSAPLTPARHTPRGGGAFAGHVLATIPADEEDALPIGVTVRHGGDEIEAELRDCPELHGEVATQTLVAFACGDGVMTVTDDGGWHSAKIDCPSRDGRLWTLAGGHGLDRAAGALSQSGPPYGALSSVAIIDLAAGSATNIETPAPVFSVGVDPATGSVIALQTDGALSRIDPSAREVLATTEPIVEPFAVDCVPRARRTLRR